MKFVHSIDETLFARVIPRVEGVFGSVVFPSNSKAELGPDVPYGCLRSLGLNRGWVREVFRDGSCGGRMDEGLSSVEKKCDDGGVKKKKKKNSGRRGEKVKFRIGPRKDKMGISDLELRNGIYRGGKRVCLVKRLNNYVFGDKEEQMWM